MLLCKSSLNLFKSLTLPFFLLLLFFTCWSGSPRPWLSWLRPWFGFWKPIKEKRFFFGFPSTKKKENLEMQPRICVWPHLTRIANRTNLCLSSQLVWWVNPSRFTPTLGVTSTLPHWEESTMARLLAPCCSQADACTPLRVWSHMHHVSGIPSMQRLTTW